jgi:iron complex outermembrane receptor protein
MRSGGLLRKQHRRAWDLAKVLAMTILSGPGSLGAAPVRAADGVLLHIDLAPGSLQRSLERLAELTQLQILYDPDLLRGLTTPGMHGDLTARQALEELLAPTDIAYEFTAPDAVALHEKPHGVRSVPGAAAEAPSAPIHTVTISTDRAGESTYGAGANLTSVKLDESSLLVPFSTASLTQQVLRDQQVTRLEDVVEFVGGTEVVPDGQSSTGFEIRGFPTYQYYLDGVRVAPDLNHDGFRDFANIDHIEIVKGPASLLYGRTEPGGLINVITKQPLATPMLSVEEQAGSFDRRGTLIDAGGPLSSQGSLLYRFNAAWETAGSFRDIPDSRRIFLAPVVSWQASPRTETTAYLEYLNSHDPSDSGLPLVGDHLPPVPIGRSLEEGGEIHTTDLRVGIRGSYTFGDGWILRHHVDARWLQAPQAPQLALAADGLEAIQCSANSCPVDRQLIAIPVAGGYTDYASVEVSRELAAWRTRHSLLAGIELFETEANSRLETSTGFNLTTDLFDPRNVPLDLALFQEPHEEIDRNARERWASAYFQDQVAFREEFYLLLGLRFDSAWANIGQSTGTGVDGEVEIPYFVQDAKAKAFKKRVGFVWHPLSSLSLYAKYTENFGATPGLYVTASGNTGLYLPQQSATEREAGVKLEFADGRVAATLAGFDLVKENISSALLEPALDPSGALFLTGSARNVGVEADVHGEVAPGLQVLANYAYTQSKIMNYAGDPFVTSTSGAEMIGYNGDRLFGVPRNGGSALGSYRVADGVLRGFKFGVGVIVRGAREGDNVNDYELPGFSRWNTFAGYDWRAGGTRMSVQVNVDNVFNAQYFESVSGTHTVMPGYPRRWLGSLRVEF